MPLGGEAIPEGSGSIQVLDPAGSFDIEPRVGVAIEAHLRACGIPLTAVRTFALGPDDRLIPTSVTRRVRSASERFVVLPLRNLPLATRVIAAEHPDPFVGEGFQYERMGEVGAHPIGRDAVLDWAAKETALALGRIGVDPAQHHLVVGYSGGGDSMLLGAALDRIADRFASIELVMVLGVRDWDRQQSDAVAMSAGRVRIIEDVESAHRLGISSVTDLFREFRRAFPSVGNEILGTWLVRQVLGSIAAERSHATVLLGFNREDLVAEGLYRISQGRRPLTAPVRHDGDLRLCFPLWRLPKGCIDVFGGDASIRNVLNRDPSDDMGRAAFYRGAYALSASDAGLDLDILEGMSELAESDDANAALRPEPDAESSWRRLLRQLATGDMGATAR